MELISRGKAVALIVQAKKTGRWCSARVVKRTRERKFPAPPPDVRTFNFRGGVTKGVTGAGMRYDPDVKGLIVVWDRTAEDFRTIAIEGILDLQIEGKKYRVAQGSICT